MTRHLRLKTLLVPAVAFAAIGFASVLPAEEFAGQDGAQLYKRLCASCHGPDGAGDGPVAASLKNRPPDLAGITVRHRGEFPEARLRQIIDGRAGVLAHGARDMPVWGTELPQAGADADALITRLIAQLRAMQKPGRR